MVVFAIRATVKNSTDKLEEILHTVMAVKNALGQVRFADYAQFGYTSSLKTLVTRLGYGELTSQITLLSMPGGMSGVVIDGIKNIGPIAKKLSEGAIILLEGLTAIEVANGKIEFALPVIGAAATIPFQEDAANHAVLKGSFDAYKKRKVAGPIENLPAVFRDAGQNTAPRSDWLTGVQFRLNALGFGAGIVDGKMTVSTNNAILAFQRSYPPLKVDGIPGPKTQAKLVNVCKY